MSLEPLSPEFLALQEAVAGRYSLVRELGRGGMGIVYLAREVALERLVAIKLLPPALAREPKHRDRFLQEARTAAQLAHPNIVPIHAVEQAGELVFIVMEYIPGETLGARLRRQGIIPVNDAMRITQEVAWALTLAHSRGVVHRDIKPDNILLDEHNERAVVTDFGIAGVGSVENTPTVGMGTQHYMAPEQALGAVPDVRGDVYSLGVTAYQMVTGHRPFEGYAGAALLTEQHHAEAPSVLTEAPMLPRRFAESIDKALARNPADRWGSVAEMAREVATARAVVPAIPPILRAFARLARERINTQAAAITGVAMMGALFVGTIGTGLPEELLLTVFLASAVTGAAVSAITLLPPTRTVLRAGYTRASALRAVDSELAEVEELPVAVRPRGWRVEPGVIAASSLVAAGLGITLLQHARGAGGIALGILALAAGVLGGAGLIRDRIRPQRRIWWRLMKGRFGRMLFQLAGIGLSNLPEAPDAAEPTALALGSAVIAIYEKLPEGQRKVFAAVPDLASRLERLALDRARSGSTEAVMALETLRLDLLRLRAGELDQSTLTEDLVRLRDIGIKIDARLEAKAL